MFSKPPEALRPKHDGTVRVTVDYGYDLHRIRIAETVFARIQAGQPLVVEGQGFPVEGVLERDLWAFNYVAVGAVQVSTDTGREVFEGNLWDADVDVGRTGEIPE